MFGPNHSHSVVCRVNDHTSVCYFCRVSSLVKWVKKIQKKYHDPPLMMRTDLADGYDVCVTNGSQDGLSKIFEMVGKRGDYILVDNPCYAGTLSMVRTGLCFIQIFTILAVLRRSV